MNDNPSQIVNPFEHYDQYERIYDIIMYLGFNTILKFNVDLAHYSDKSNREMFHKEFEYMNKQTNMPVISIRRDYNFYLSIENVKMINNIERQIVRIGIEEITLLKHILHQAAKWFTNAEYKDLYAIHNGQLIMTRKVTPVGINNLPYNKYIEFEPAIYIANEEAIPGVRMTLSDNANFTDMPLNRFMGFKYIIDTFNMYQSAQNMINYIARPEPGHNLSSYVDGTNYTRYGRENITGPKGRTVACQTKDPTLNDLGKG